MVGAAAAVVAAGVVGVVPTPPHRILVIRRGFRPQTSPLPASPSNSTTRVKHPLPPPPPGGPVYSGRKRWLRGLRRKEWRRVGVIIGPYSKSKPHRRHGRRRHQLNSPPIPPTFSLMMCVESVCWGCCCVVTAFQLSKGGGVEGRGRRVRAPPAAAMPDPARTTERRKFTLYPLHCH